MWYTGSQKVVVYIRGTELYRQQKVLSCAMELKSNFSLNQAWLEQGWVLVIALTVVVVVGSPTTDLLESVDCLLRDADCTLFHKC